MGYHNDFILYPLDNGKMGVTILLWVDVETLSAIGITRKRVVIRNHFRWLVISVAVVTGISWLAVFDLRGEANVDEV